MTLKMLAEEIEERMRQLPFKKLIGEKTGYVYLEFYENGYRTVTYKFDATTFKKIYEIGYILK